jgi:hypothetical protein
MRDVKNFETIQQVIDTAERCDTDFVVIYRDSTRMRRRIGYSVHRYSQSARHAAESAELEASVFGVANGNLKDLGWRTADDGGARRDPSSPDLREVST